MEKKVIYKFFDGTATPEEKSTVKQWLEASPGNKDELMREREFFDVLVLAGYRTKAASRKVKRFPFIYKEMLKVAVICGVLFTLGVYFYTAKVNEIGEAVNQVNVPAGQRVNLVLSDGTNVWLNARSKMQYPAFFAGGKREITLNGEAYFEVEHNEKKPFIVHTNKFDIEVLGTKFNVDAYDDSDEFSTALMEGSVIVTDKHDPVNTLRLTPNHVARMQGGRLSAGQIEDLDPYRWRDGLICFKNTGFAELMQRFEKCYGVRIRIENNNLSDHSFSGKFRIADGIDKALLVLQRDADYTFKRDEDDDLIYIR